MGNTDYRAEKERAYAYLDAIADRIYGDADTVRGTPELGFREEKLIAILVMLGSATTSSCFVMAKNMGHRGVITACAVMMTTLLSAFSLTFWLFVLRTIGVI